MWTYCGLIMLVATVDKLGGSTLASWLRECRCGQPQDWHAHEHTA
jgi:hypothetical protein